MLRDSFASRQLSPAEGSLPEPLLRVVRHPPPMSSWIPETIFVAATLATYDEAFGGEDLSAFEDWVCEVDRALFRNPVYRILFALISPSRLVALAASRWSAFHRGTTLTILERSPESARLRLDFPDHLFNHVMIVAFMGALRAAALEAGAAKATGHVDSASATRAEYSVSWSA